MSNLDLKLTRLFTLFKTLKGLADMCQLHLMTHKFIMISLLGFLCLQPLLLTGHHSQITAMTFGKGNRPVLLCSASSDYVIVWDIEHCQRRIREGKFLLSFCI